MTDAPGAEPTTEPSTEPLAGDYGVLEIHQDVSGGLSQSAKITGTMGPGVVQLLHGDPEHSNVVTGSVILPHRQREIPPAAMAVILEKTEELRTLIAKTLGVSPEQLDIRLRPRSGRSQTVVAATWDRLEGRHEIGD